MKQRNDSIALHAHTSFIPSSISPSLQLTNFELQGPIREFLNIFSNENFFLLKHGSQP